MKKAKVVEWDLVVDERTGDKKITFSLKLGEKIKTYAFILNGIGIRLFLKWCGVRNWRSLKTFNPDKLIGREVELPQKSLKVRR